MITPLPIGLVNTVLPIAVLAVLAIVMPRLITGGETLAHRRVIVAVVLSTLLLIALGAALFAMAYGMRGVPLFGTFAQAPLATGAFFLRLSALAALIWLPLLALVWYSLAQGVEHRRGAALAKRKVGI